MNHIFIGCLVAILAAQIIKFIVDFISKGRPNIRLLYSNGAMPSSHSSILATLVVLVGYLEGLDSTLFGVSIIFSLLIIGDAMGIRSQTGKQARALNKLIDNVDSKPLRELVGHKPVEVLGGIILGIIVAIIYIALFIK